MRDESVMGGYYLTAKGTAECTIKLLNDSTILGYLKPSLAYGSEFINMFVIKKN
jgi:hypothetical protein